MIERDHEAEHAQAIRAVREAEAEYCRALGHAREQVRSKREWLAETQRRLEAIERRRRQETTET